jgi:hypothetical protein
MRKLASHLKERKYIEDILEHDDESNAGSQRGRKYQEGVEICNGKRHNFYSVKYTTIRDKKSRMARWERRVASMGACRSTYTKGDLLACGAIILKLISRKRGARDMNRSSAVENTVMNFRSIKGWNFLH